MGSGQSGGAPSGGTNSGGLGAGGTAGAAGTLASAGSGGTEASGTAGSTGIGGTSTLAGSGGTSGAINSGGTTAAVGGTSSTLTGGTSAGTGGAGRGGTFSSGGSGGSGGTRSPLVCDWSGGPPAFGTAQSLGTPNTSASEIDPVISHDGLTVYFVSYRDSKKGNDIYLATRLTPTANFGAGSLFAAASTSSNDTHFFEAASGLEAFLSSDRSGTTGGMDIFRATRATTADSWGTFTSLPNVNSPTGDFDPYLEADGLTLWFDPEGRTGGLGQQDLFYAERTSVAADFGTPVAANSLNSSGNDWNVSLTDDAKVIVFQSDRGGSAHVYFAYRPSGTATFSAPSVVTALDPYMTTLSDPFVSPDGCAIYFAAQLAGGAGSFDLYVIQASP